MTTRLRVQTAPRTFGAAVLARCERATAVLEHVCTSDGRWAHGHELHAAWPQVHHVAVPADVTGRWRRALEPALVDGSVCVRVEARATTYALATLAANLAPAGDSGLVRVEAALRAAFTRCGGAVPVEEVERDLAAAGVPSDNVATPTWSRLGRLVEEGRIHMVVPGDQTEHRRRYYAPLDQPLLIARAAELPTNRRERAIHALWRASGGRPFTTRAITRYARARSHFRIENDPTYGWTNALPQFCTLGLVCRANEATDDRGVRWALAAEWRGLTDEERATRLRDPYGRTEPPDCDDADAVASPSNATERGGTVVDHALNESAAAYSEGIDVADVSRNQNMAALVRHAIAVRGTETSVEERAVRATQPVTLRDLQRLAERFPKLLPAGMSLVTALHEATRVRPDMRAAAVAHLGTVRNTAYYALKNTAEARAFVDWHRVVSDENHVRLARVIHELEEDTSASRTRGARLPTRILRARASLLVAELRTLSARLDETEARAPLIASQRTRSQSLRTMLIERNARLRYVVDEASSTVAEAIEVPAPCTEPHHDTSVDANAAAPLLDIAEAAEQLRVVAPYKMASSRELWSRMLHGVRIRSAQAPVTLCGQKPSPGVHDRPQVRAGRPVENAFDRVSFAFWAARRFGGATFGGVSEQARRCIGELRETRMVCEALLNPDEMESHTELCAALGFLDDVQARDALVAYLARAIEDDTRARARIAGGGAHACPPRQTNSAAIATAVFGLARLPFGGLATSLRASERAVLEIVERSFSNDIPRAFAALIVDGWTHDWSPEQWMRF